MGKTQWSFARALLHWYDRAGRKHLPWQQDRDPYKIWVSEIMLQQTQVTTVIAYFERFIDRFPNISELAAADVDEVLHLWTGLGYYARARNLHHAAQQICDHHHGEFPADVEAVYQLPGIGRSTAHAILTFSFDHSLSILDGNVKRVLARQHRVQGWPGHRPVEQRLWQLAENLTPARRTADYNQAIMDLGALVCLRRRPLCAACPVSGTCQAARYGEQHELPGRAPKKIKPVRAVGMVMVMKEHQQVLLEKRPPQGIWGGLWSFPELEGNTDPGQHMAARYGLCIETDQGWEVLRHSFTHFHLDITPIPARLMRADSLMMEKPGLVWYNLRHPDARGLAAPVKKLLEKLG